MARGGSATRAPAARSAAAAKGWAARKRREAAALELPRAEIDAMMGTQADRQLRGPEIRALIDRAIAGLRAREGE